MRHSIDGRLLPACCLLWGVACATSGPAGFLRAPSPYEAYADRLEQSGLDTTALGRDWVRAGAEALTSAADVTTPFLESGYLPADTPGALAYRLNLTRGRRLVVDVQVDSQQPVRVFVDLFAVRDGEPPDRLVSLDEGTTTLAYDVDRDGAYLLRVQPELLRDVRVTLTQRTESTLRFPVEGFTAAAVQSGFGAERDGGARGHEGIDIFAPRGTPVAAVVDGTARTSTNGLGGNVVWLRGGGLTFYYAHLDRWEIEGSRRVAAGEVLGYVGNSGNARTTSPHLHFGIYERGAIDPLPLVQPDDATPGAPAASPDRLGRQVRTARGTTPLRAAPGRRAATIDELARATVGRAIAISGGSIRLSLPDGRTGYVDQAAVVDAEGAPVRQATLPAGTALHAAPDATAPRVTTMETAQSADVLGEFDGHTLVRVGDQRTGWLVP